MSNPIPAFPFNGKGDGTMLGLILLVQLKMES